jgi:hypothetical protein
MMKLQEVILKAMAKKLSAAEIAGMRVRNMQARLPVPAEGLLRDPSEGQRRVRHRRTEAGGCAKQILRDEVILLMKTQEAGSLARLRRIEAWVEDQQETMVFVTSHLKLAAATQIEPFFKSLKQSLRIKTCGHQRQRHHGADLDSTDRHAGALPATAEHLRVEPVQSDRAAASPTVCLPGLDCLVERALRTASGKLGRRPLPLIPG